MRTAAAAILLMSLPVVASAQQPQAAAPAATYSEAQLHSFARASVELDELNRGLGSDPSQAQRQQAAAQAQTILQRHNLDAATYNAIATQARTDEDLAQRIRAMRAHEQD
ncbi:MAG: DUF4168 domain-containing protein [Vitreimonas sp.]